MLTATLDAVTRVLAAGELGREVFAYVPGDIGAYPCIVIGNPDADPSLDAAGQAADVTLPVYVCGRPAQSADAQREVHELADRVWLTFIAAPARRLTGVTLSIQDIRATTIAVGSASVPAFTFTVLATVLTCPT